MTLVVSSRKLLTRLLDQPQLVALIQSLPAASLLRLIDEIGLEDAGEIVALATVEQLTRIFDDDLWRSPKPGHDARFDGARFGLWLEVMLEAGAPFAAAKLAEMSEDLLAVAFESRVLVVDLDELTLQYLDEQLEKVIEGGLYADFDRFRVIARAAEGWDALSSALAALDDHQPDTLLRLLGRLAESAAEWIDLNGGLYDVLTSAEMFENDAAAERDDRRARTGHVSPATARAFLALPTIPAPTSSADRSAANSTPDETEQVLVEKLLVEKLFVEKLLAEPRDAITRAYFRELDSPILGTPPAPADPLSNLAGGPSDLFTDLFPDLRSDIPLLPASLSENALRRALAHLPEAELETRLLELTYLANVLVTAHQLRPLEAAEAAMARCSLGLERASTATGRDEVALLAAHGCEKFFRLGN